MKEISGKTAGQLIDDAIIMEARLLLSEPSSSIARIANELQFGDQSLFGRLFKKTLDFLLLNIETKGLRYRYIQVLHRLTLFINTAIKFAITGILFVIIILIYIYLKY